MANPGLMAGAFLSNPYAFAEAMSREMDRMFGSFGEESWAPNATPSPGRQAGRDLPASARGARTSQWVPQLEVRQRGDEIVVSADLPGITPDDVQVEVEDGVLTISGERRQASESDEEGVYRSERSYGAFSRSVPLPEGVDEEQVKARFEHGVLEVTVPVPQPQRQRARRIEIQSGQAKPQR
jgi:HSP20 family protein